MKTDKIQVNKTPENAAGIEVEIVQPESPLETGVMEYLLTAFVHQARSNKALPYELPDAFTIQHQAAGSFAAIGTKKDAANPYYQPPRPLAVLAVRKAGAGFDVIHAEVKQPTQAQKPSATTPAEQPQAEHSAADAAKS